MTSFAARRRVPPRERFAGSERVFDLDEEFAELPAQSVARQGHMQKTLFRLGPTTTAIFVFEKGSGLEQYSVEGEAMIHVLEGRLTVRTAETEYELTRGQIVLLNPGVPHDLSAAEPSRILLNVVLEES